MEMILLEFSQQKNNILLSYTILISVQLSEILLILCLFCKVKQTKAGIRIEGTKIDDDRPLFLQKEESDVKSKNGKNGKNGEKFGFA